MIIIMKPQASKEDVQKVTSLIESKGLQVHLSEGSQVTIVGVEIGRASCRERV